MPLGGVRAGQGDDQSFPFAVQLGRRAAAGLLPEGGLQPLTDEALAEALDGGQPGASSPDDPFVRQALVGQQAVGLQINSAQDVSHGPWADVSNDPVRHGLAGQVLTRPMRDVQPLGHGLQASQLNDLCPLHRRDPQVTSAVALPLIGKQATEPPVAIPVTGSPKGGFVALELRSEVISPLACGDPQNNSRTPDLIPRRRVTVTVCSINLKQRFYIEAEDSGMVPAYLSPASRRSISWIMLICTCASLEAVRRS